MVLLQKRATHRLGHSPGYGLERCEHCHRVVPTKSKRIGDTCMHARGRNSSLPVLYQGRIVSGIEPLTLLATHRRVPRAAVSPHAQCQIHQPPAQDSAVDSSKKKKCYMSRTDITLFLYIITKERNSFKAESS